MDRQSAELKQQNILIQKRDMIEKAKEAFTHPGVTVGAPLSGSLVGFIEICRQMAPVLTVISLLVGIVLGIMSYRLKKKLADKKITQSDSDSIVMN